MTATNLVDAAKMSEKPKIKWKKKSTVKEKRKPKSMSEKTSKMYGKKNG